MKPWVRRLPPISEKKNFIFNMFGSTCNAAVSVLLLVFVSQILGETDAGLFALAFPTAQMLYTVASFEVRNVQITDVKRQFSFSDVLNFRFCTVLLMAVVCAVFLLIQGYTGQKALLICLLCVYMAALAISDVFQGILHQNGYLSLAGKSLGYHTLSGATAFIVVLLLTHDLILSAIAMAVTAILWTVLYDIPYSRNFESYRPHFSLAATKGLLFGSLPLFLSVFLQQYILNAPKYAIDAHLDEIAQSHYGFLVMPVAFINLFSIFIFRPQLVTLSNEYATDLVRFRRRVLRLFAWIGGATVFAMVAGYLLGIPLLNLLYNTDLNAYRELFLLLLFGGGLGAGASLTITVLTVMRKQQFGLIVFGAVALFSVFVPDLLVREWAVPGAALSYVAEMVLLCVGLLIVYAICLRRAERSVSHE